MIHALISSALPKLYPYFYPGVEEESIKHLKIEALVESTLNLQQLLLALLNQCSIGDVHFCGHGPLVCWVDWF